MGKMIEIFSCKMCPFAGRELATQGRHTLYCIKTPVEGGAKLDGFRGNYRLVAEKIENYFYEDLGIPEWCPLDDMETK